MQLPARVWSSDHAVRMAAAQDWAAARLAWETRVLGRRLTLKAQRVIPKVAPAR